MFPGVSFNSSKFLHFKVWLMSKCIIVTCCIKAILCQFWCKIVIELCWFSHMECFGVTFVGDCDWKCLFIDSVYCFGFWWSFTFSIVLYIQLHLILKVGELHVWMFLCKQSLFFPTIFRKPHLNIKVVPKVVCST